MQNSKKKEKKTKQNPCIIIINNNKKMYSLGLSKLRRLRNNHVTVKNLVYKKLASYLTSIQFLFPRRTNELFSLTSVSRAIKTDFFRMVCTKYIKLHYL